jgi:hypothetical protein
MDIAQILLTMELRPLSSRVMLACTKKVRTTVLASWYSTGTIIAEAPMQCTIVVLAQIIIDSCLLSRLLLMDL